MCHATKSSVVKEEGNEKRLLGKHGFNRYQISFFSFSHSVFIDKFTNK